MLEAFLVASFLIGLFLTYIWSSNGFTNACIKVVFTCYMLWAGLLLLSQMWHHINIGAMHLI